MFGGQFKKKKVVSYRGSSKAVKTREEIVREAERAREKRNLERTQLNASYLIQRAYRAYRSNKAAADVLARCSPSLPSGGLREDGNAGRGLECAIQVLRSSLFVFFARGRAGWDALVQCLRSLLHGHECYFGLFGDVASSGAESTDAGEERGNEPCRAGLSIHQWLVQLRAIRKSITVLLLGKEMAVEDICMLVDCLARISPHCPMQHSGRYHLGLGEYFRALANVSVQLAAAEKGQVSSPEVHVHLLMDALEAGGCEAWPVFLENAMRGQAARSLPCAALAQRLCAFLAQHADRIALETCRAAASGDAVYAVTAVLRGLLQSDAAEAPEPAMAALVSLLFAYVHAFDAGKGLRSSGGRYLPENAMDEEEEEGREEAGEEASGDDEEMDEGGSGRREHLHMMYHATLPPSAALAPALHSLAELVELFCRRFLARSQWPPTAPLPPAITELTLGALPLSSAVLLLARTLLRFRNVHKRLVERLAMFTDLTQFAWRELHSTPEVNMLVSSGHTESDGLDAVVELFCTLYHFQLVATDDDDFFSRQSYFPLEEVVRISNFIKALVYRHYSLLCSVRFGQKFSDQRIIGAASALLEQLYIRDCRRRFLKKGHWETKDIDPQGVLSGVLQDDATSLAIIADIPFCLPLSARVLLFMNLVDEDRAALPSELRGFFGGRRLTVHRATMFYDALAALSNLDSLQMRERLRVEFINHEGVLEAGIDGGGLFKEFMEQVIETGFSEEFGLFKKCQGGNGGLYPNPLSAIIHGEEHLRLFHFLGRLLGKCVYESVLVNVRLAPFFASKLLGKKMTVNDIYSLDPELFKNLMALKNYEGNVEEDLDLTFSVVRDEMGVTRPVNLLRNGSEIAVTNDNRIQYIVLQAHYHLNHVIRAQSKAFLGGFYDMIAPEWIHMFNEEELQFLLAGTEEAVDVDDLHQHCVYNNYEEGDPSVHSFWRVVRSFTAEEQRLLLRFVTSTSNSPLLGFGQLEPKFCIARASDDLSRLPTAATCMNLLRLPPYPDDETMREKLLYAIRANAGFELS